MMSAASRSRSFGRRVWVGKERTDVGPVFQRDGLVVTGYGDVEQFLEDPELEENSRYTVAGGTSDRSLIASIVVAA